MVVFKSGSPTWARTRDLRINSPSLYRLSYRGIKDEIIYKMSETCQETIYIKTKIFLYLFNL